MNMKINDFYKKYSFKSVDGSISGLIDLSQEQLNQLHDVLIGIVDDIMKLCSEKNLTCLQEYESNTYQNIYS